MSEPMRPQTFEEAIDVAREFTATEGSDDRSPADIYFDVARLGVVRDVSPTLAAVPISDDHKGDVIDREARTIAEEAFEQDQSGEPVRLTEMLDRFGVFGFVCVKHCDRRGRISSGALQAMYQTERYKKDGLMLITGMMMTQQMDETFHDVLDERGLLSAPASELFTAPRDGQPVTCKSSPDCQNECPLPEDDAVLDGVLETAVEIMVTEKHW